MEQIYVGTKIISAEPMDEGTFTKTRKVRFSAEWEEARSSRPGYRVRYEDGYLSWSPKETFERAYRLITPEEMELLKL